MDISAVYLTKNKYSRPAIPMDIIKGMVIHYVGNPGSSAIANRNYFEGLKNGTSGVYASSQYIVGLQGEIIQCMPETEVAYHAGNLTYNKSYIGIECCHPDSTGKFNDFTYAALIELCGALCKKYNINIEHNIIRHFDVTGKLCPLWYVKNDDDWRKLKEDIRIVVQEDYKVNQVNIKINGIMYLFNRILLNDSNFVKLSDFKKVGFEVGYDEKTNTPWIEY